MTTVFLSLALASAVAWGDGSYKAESAGPLPESAAALKSVLDPQGVRILDPAGKVYCEIWLRSTQPADAKSTEQNITLPELPHGVLIGVISYPQATSDRRGQQIKAGVYTLRYSQFPITGDHQGIAPQRDFLILGPIATDKDPAATPDFKTLMTWAAQASGTNHPMSLSIWKADQPQPGFAKEGEHDWVLQRTIGKIPLAIILIGRAEA